MIRAITLKNYIANYFAEVRHDNIQMIVMGHKPAQIVYIERMSCDTIYITTYNGADLFKNFNKIYEENFGGFMKVKLDLKMRSHLYILMFMMALVRVRLILLDNT